MTQDLNAIVITLDQATIKARSGGYRQIVKDWLSCDGIQYNWEHKLANIPVEKQRDQITLVLWVVAGRIRWKSLVLEFIPFDPGRVCYLSTFDFEPIPRRDQIEMKGFRGFRYIRFES